MAYGDIKTLSQALHTYQLDLINQSQLFSQIQPVQPSIRLQQDLEESLDLAVSIDTEKARSELIASRVLLEVRRQFQGQISFFSGSTFNVDASRGLTGECDFILSASNNQLEISVPVLTAVEAKNVDIKLGLGQCVAQMIGAQTFNQKYNLALPIFGAVTTGVGWKFIKLEATTLWIDLTEYLIPPQVDQVLGILCQPFRDYFQRRE